MGFSALIIDDQDHEVRLLEAQLKIFGLEIFRAANLSQATERLSSVCPHILFVDVNLGEARDGIDWLAEVKKGPFKDIPALILTASKSKEVIQKAAKVGIKHYILKPASAPALKKKILDIIRDLEEKPLFQIQLQKEMTARARFLGQVVAISEVALAVSSSLASLGPSVEVEFESSLFYEMAVKKPRRLTMLSKQEAQSFGKLGPYKSFFQVTGWGDEDQKKIRDWIKSHNLRKGV